jgi:hypothetical protein
MKPYLYLITGLLATGCVANQPAGAPRPYADNSEYYVPTDPMAPARKRLLPDPINGLGQASEASIRVNEIRLTSQYTVLYMTFRDDRSQNSGSSIAFSSEKAHLITPDGKRKFGFVKAEGIELSPNRQDVKPGERVDFVLYFERLAPDVTEFGMFECESDNTNSCWNVVGMNARPEADSTTVK